MESTAVCAVDKEFTMFNEEFAFAGTLVIHTVFYD